MKPPLTVPDRLWRVGERVASRIIDAGALANEHEAERLLLSECERACIRSDEERAQVSAIAAAALGCLLDPKAPA